MISLTPKVWEIRPMPGPPKSLESTMKHGRFVFCPVDGRVWNIGGDWNQTVTSGCAEVYSYDVALDDGNGTGLGWILEDQYCPGPGVFKFANPDQVTTVFDTNRNLIWIIPGYMPSGGAGSMETVTLATALTEGGSENIIDVSSPVTGYPTAGSLAIVNDDLTVEYIIYNGIDTSAAPINKFLNVQRGYGNTPKGAHAVGESLCRPTHSSCGSYLQTPVRGQLPWTSFTLNPITKEWKVRSRIRTNLAGMNPGNGEGSNNGFYDAINDKIIRITGSSNGLFVRTFNLPDLSFTTSPDLHSGLGLNSVPIGNNDIAWNPDDRHAYIIQPGSDPSVMIRYNVDAMSFTKITGSGTPPRSTIASEATGINCFYPKWDSINKVILWPFVYNFSSGSEFPTDDPNIDPTSPTHTCRLYIYHPTTNTWETDAMLPGPPIYPQGNTWVFNPKENCLMGTGKGDSDKIRGMNLYRYASTSPAHRPVGLSAALR